MARMGVRSMPSQGPINFTGPNGPGVLRPPSSPGVAWPGSQVIGGASPNIQDALQSMRQQLSFPPGHVSGPNTMGGGLNPQASGNGLPPRLQAMAAQNPQAAQARFAQFKAGQLPGQQGMQPQGRPGGQPPMGVVGAGNPGGPQPQRGGTPPIYAGGGGGQMGASPQVDPAAGQGDPRQMGDFIKGRDPATGGVAEMPGSLPAIGMQDAPGQATAGPGGLPTKPNFGLQDGGGYQSPPWMPPGGGGLANPQDQLRNRIGQMMRY